MPASERFIPALRYRVLTSMYDALVQRAIPERELKGALVRQAGIEPGQRVLDLACGTATLTLLASEAHPEAYLFGLDGDQQILALARAKIVRANAVIPLIVGLSDALPFPDGAFDRVLNSMMLHHLSLAAKIRTLREAWRVLRPAGSLHVADWGKARSRGARARFYAVQLLDGFATTGDNIAGRLPECFERAGFTGIEETRQYPSLFGPVSLYRMRKSV